MANPCPVQRGNLLLVMEQSACANHVSRATLCQLARGPGTCELANYSAPIVSDAFEHLGRD
jgi:hypothetical protein